LIKSGFNKNAIGENFNLAAGIEISITDMAKKVIKASGKSIDIKFAPRRKWDTKPRLCASIEKASKLIDYKPIVSFEEGFRENVKWFNENWSKISELADFKPGMNSAVRKK
jgi:nucleoside-diphosphate-sugar epimerase